MQGTKYGNHSDTHPHVNNLSYEKNVEQINNCDKKIEQITGSKTNLYRGPYGEYNDTVIKAARDTNHITIQWSIDSLDYQRIEPKLQLGSIILMHNGTENTALSLDMLLTKIEEKGYKVTKVSDIVYKENYTIDNNGIQHKNN